jgi:hypothetical protein
MLKHFGRTNTILFLMLKMDCLRFNVSCFHFPDFKLEVAAIAGSPAAMRPVVMLGLALLAGLFSTGKPRRLI